MQNFFTNHNEIQHLAIIMDGNSRWANSLGLDKFLGYTQGAGQVKVIVEEVLRLGIANLTLYAFSIENWNRPKEDVDYLLTLLDAYLNKEVEDLHAKNIKLQFIGDLSKLSAGLKNSVDNAVNLTKDNNALNLYIAFSYGGRDEILRACKAYSHSGSKDLSEDEFRKYLYCPEMPDVDFLIRTGKEQRMSNFLPWQTSYTELYFSDKFWPEFAPKDLTIAIDDYKTRKRNFGRAR